MVAGMVDSVRILPVRFLAGTGLPPTEWNGHAKEANPDMVLRGRNTAVALGNIAPRYAGKARPFGAIGRMRAPPDATLAPQRT